MICASCEGGLTKHQAVSHQMAKKTFRPANETWIFQSVLVTYLFIPTVCSPSNMSKTMAKKWKGLFLHVDQVPSFVYVTVKNELHLCTCIHLHQITERSTNIMRFWKPRLKIWSKHMQRSPAAWLPIPAHRSVGPCSRRKKGFVDKKKMPSAILLRFFFIFEFEDTWHLSAKLLGTCMLHSYNRLHPSTFPICKWGAERLSPSHLLGKNIPFGN